MRRMASKILPFNSGGRCKDFVACGVADFISSGGVLATGTYDSKGPGTLIPAADGLTSSIARLADSRASRLAAICGRPLSNAVRHMRRTGLSPPVRLSSASIPGNEAQRHSIARHTYVGRDDDSHRGKRATSVPNTYSRSPSVNTPRNPSELRRAKQMSGTASATKRSRFMGHRVQLVVPTKYYPDLSNPTTLSKKFP
jgi:hypothetical protein